LGAPGLQPAFVLHTRRYGDSSLVVELLTRAQGRLACVAKGALQARRPAARIQPFQPLWVDVRGRGEVLSLSRVESGDAPQRLVGRSLYCGFYLNELLLKLTPREDPCTELFDDYGLAVRGLAEGASAEAVLRHFETRLLDHLGLGLALELDTLGQPIRPESHYTYDVDSGAVPCRERGATVISGATLMALRSGDLSDRESLLEARALMRRVLDHHLDGRPLRSRELFR
jgi:DNA repair protein RecO (recombination protein O)